MKALSIRQPWAWLILNAGKDIENRSWRTHFRGPFLVHASAKAEKTGANFWGDLRDDLDGNLSDPPLSYPLSGFVGVAEVIDCRQDFGRSPWFFGPWGFALANMKPLPFLPAKGRLGFFDASAAAATYRQMGVL